jgi:hypothetical protein
MQIHERQKRKQLDDLKRETRMNDRMFEKLGARTRSAQMEKAKQMTETNPLKADQLAIYSRNLEAVRKRYTKEMQWGDS